MHGADSITKLSEWINTPIKNKMIVYTGDFENTVGDVKLINYRHLLLWVVLIFTAVKKLTKNPRTVPFNRIDVGISHLTSYILPLTLFILILPPIQFRHGKKFFKLSEQRTQCRVHSNFVESWRKSTIVNFSILSVFIFPAFINFLFAFIHYVV